MLTHKIRIIFRERERAAHHLDITSENVTSPFCNQIITVCENCLQKCQSNLHRLFLTQTHKKGYFCIRNSIQIILSMSTHHYRFIYIL